MGIRHTQVTVDLQVLDRGLVHVGVLRTFQTPFLNRPLATVAGGESTRYSQGVVAVNGASVRPVRSNNCTDVSRWTRRLRIVVHRSPSPRCRVLTCHVFGTRG